MIFNLRLLLSTAVFLASVQARANDFALPQIANSVAVFDRVVALYHQGHMPDWSDFDPTQAPSGNAVCKSDPNILLQAQMISLESGDVVVGNIRRTGFFPLNWADKPFTIEMGQECLADRGNDCGSPPSPLELDQSQDAFLASIPATNNYCALNLRLRKTILPNGSSVLVGIISVVDKGPACTKYFYGEVVKAFYVTLS